MNPANSNLPPIMEILQAICPTATQVDIATAQIAAERFKRDFEREFGNGKGDK